MINLSSNLKNKVACMLANGVYDAKLVDLNEDADGIVFTFKIGDTVLDWKRTNRVLVSAKNKEYNPAEIALAQVASLLGSDVEAWQDAVIRLEVKNSFVYNVITEENEVVA